MIFSIFLDPDTQVLIYPQIRLLVGECFYPSRNYNNSLFTYKEKLGMSALLYNLPKHIL